MATIINIQNKSAPIPTFNQFGQGFSKGVSDVIGQQSQEALIRKRREEQQILDEAKALAKDKARKARIDNLSDLMAQKFAQQPEGSQPADVSDIAQPEDEAFELPAVGVREPTKKTLTDAKLLATLAIDSPALADNFLESMITGPSADPIMGISFLATQLQQLHDTSNLTPANVEQLRQKVGPLLTLLKGRTNVGKSLETIKKQNPNGWALLYHGKIQTDDVKELIKRGEKYATLGMLGDLTKTIQELEDQGQHGEAADLKVQQVKLAQKAQPYFDITDFNDPKPLADRNLTASEAQQVLATSQIEAIRAGRKGPRHIASQDQLEALQKQELEVWVPREVTAETLSSVRSEDIEYLPKGTKSTKPGYKKLDILFAQFRAKEVGFKERPRKPTTFEQKVAEEGREFEAEFGVNPIVRGRVQTRYIGALKYFFREDKGRKADLAKLDPKNLLARQFEFFREEKKGTLGRVQGEFEPALRETYKALIELKDIPSFNTIRRKVLDKYVAIEKTLAAHDESADDTTEDLKLSKFGSRDKIVGELVEDISRGRIKAEDVQTTIIGPDNLPEKITASEQNLTEVPEAGPSENPSFGDVNDELKATAARGEIEEVTINVALLQPEQERGLLSQLRNRIPAGREALTEQEAVDIIKTILPQGQSTNANARALVQRLRGIDPTIIQ